jgi:hypothetical protein
VDEQGKRPDHHDQNDVFVGVFQKEGGGEKKDDGAQCQKNKERQSLLEPVFQPVLFLYIHNSSIK